MNNGTALFFSIVLSCSSLFSVSSSHAEVTLYTDSEQFRDFLLKSELPARTFAKDTHRYILSHLNTFPRVYFQNQIRVKKLLSGEAAACHLMKIRTAERQNQYLFSKSTDVYLSHRLFVRNSVIEKVKPELTSNNMVNSLSELMHKLNEMTVLLIENHSYGEYLDNEISNIDESQRYYLKTPDPYLIYVKMFNLHRADFALLYPNAKYDELNNDFTALPFKNNPSLISSRIMCNKQPESQAFINEVNAILDELYQSGKFETFARKHFPKSEMPLIRQLIKTELNADNWDIGLVYPVHWNFCLYFNLINKPIDFNSDI